MRLIALHRTHKDFCSRPCRPSCLSSSAQTRALARQAAGTVPPSGASSTSASLHPPISGAALTFRLPLAVQSTSSGLGLFYTPTSQAKHDLLSGTFISLYAGEYLCTDQARQRWAAQAEHPAGEGNYILSLRLPNETIHIDPRYKGNIGRFLNHSCEPNCAIHVVRWGPDAVSRAAMFVSRSSTVQ
jgi:hypothetical protein